MFYLEIKFWLKLSNVSYVHNKLFNEIISITCKFLVFRIVLSNGTGLSFLDVMKCMKFTLMLPCF